MHINDLLEQFEFLEWAGISHVVKHGWQTALCGIYLPMAKTVTQGNPCKRCLHVAGRYEEQTSGPSRWVEETRN